MSSPGLGGSVRAVDNVLDRGGAAIANVGVAMAGVAPMAIGSGTGVEKTLNFVLREKGQGFR